MITFGTGWHAKTRTLTLEEIPDWARKGPFKKPLPLEVSVKISVADGLTIEPVSSGLISTDVAKDESDDRLQVEVDCNFVCIYCCRPEISPTGETLACGYDHLIPRAAWGDKTLADTRGNLVLACAKCNELKSDWIPFSGTFLLKKERAEYIAYARAYVDLARMAQFAAWRNRIAGKLFKTTGNSDFKPHDSYTSGLTPTYNSAAQVATLGDSRSLSTS